MIAAVFNTILIYAVFTPMHDAAHGSIATRKYAYLNSVVGHVAAMCFPVPFPAFKHLHLMHHKHTNEEGKDPDMWAGAGPVYLLPLRWMTLELKYYVSYLPKLHTRPQLEQLVAVTELVVMYGFMFALFQYGYGREALYGWVIPGRVSVFILGYLFDYLPHRPHGIPKKVDPYKATHVTSLVNKETAALTWPMLYQNYHNIHHLAPYIPFYLYAKVWYKLRPELVAKGTQIKPII